MGERVPQHVQNLVIRDYCERNNLQFLLSATEYAMQDCHLILEQVLSELPYIDGMVAYSLYQLPQDGYQRKRIYERFISYKKRIHFAGEGLNAGTYSECEKIETMWRIRLTLPDCLERFDYK